MPCEGNMALTSSAMVPVVEMVGISEQREGGQDGRAHLQEDSGISGLGPKIFIDLSEWPCGHHIRDEANRWISQENELYSIGNEVIGPTTAFCVTDYNSTGGEHRI